MTVCFHHVTYAFQSGFEIYSFLNVKEILAQNRCDIWSLSDCNDTGTHNHLVCQWALNHLAKLTKCLSRILSPYLYGRFDCMFLSCHVGVSEWIAKLLAQNRRDIWYLSDYNNTRIHNHLLSQGTPNYLVQHNVKELLSPKRCDFWYLYECNEIRTNNHLLYKRTLSHLGKFAKWLSFV